MRSSALLSSIALCFFIYFCSNKQIEYSSPDHFKINETQYIIESAAFVKLTGPSFFNNLNGLIFATDGVSFSSLNDKVLSLKGKGKILGFIIYSSEKETLNEGVHFMNLRPPYSEGDIAIGFYTLDWEEDKGSVFYDENEGSGLLSGKLTVTKEGKQTSISFKCTDEDGRLITGVFKGDLLKNLSYNTDHIDYED